MAVIAHVAGQRPAGALPERLEDPLGVERPAPAAGVEEQIVVLGAVAPSGELAARVDPGEVVAEAGRPEDLVAEQLGGVDAARVEVEVERPCRAEQVTDQLEPRRQHRDEAAQAARLPVRVGDRRAAGMSSRCVPVAVCASMGGGRPCPRRPDVEGVAGAERRVQVHQVHPPRELGEERRERPQVVAGDQAVRGIARRPRETLDEVKPLDVAARPAPRSVGCVLARPRQLELAPARGAATGRVRVPSGRTHVATRHA